MKDPNQFRGDHEAGSAPLIDYRKTMVSKIDSTKTKDR